MWYLPQESRKDKNTHTHRTQEADGKRRKRNVNEQIFWIISYHWNSSNLENVGRNSIHKLLHFTFFFVSVCFCLCLWFRSCPRPFGNDTEMLQTINYRYRVVLWSIHLIKIREVNFVINEANEKWRAIESASDGELENWNEKVTYINISI